MSQRRPALPELPSPAYSRNQAIKVVCSDRSQHARIVLHHLHDTRRLALHPAVIWPEGKRNGPPVTSTQSEDGTQNFRFRCPRCRRDVQLRPENMFRIFDALASRADNDEAHPVLDISLLAC